jgi:hypothetical protein
MRPWRDEYERITFEFRSQHDMHRSGAIKVGAPDEMGGDAEYDSAL